jgi:chromosome segregation ATPase
MASDYDPTEFIDGDFQTQKSPYSSSSVTGQSQRAPTVQEVDSQVMEQQQKLAELKRAQEEKERELASLEETRRRQMEFQTGRQEMINNLVRGVGLLEEGEFNARRDAEQMATALADLRESLAKVEAIHEEGWSGDTFQIELTRALTTLENARMEWNSARLKFDVLNGRMGQAEQGVKPAAESAPLSPLSNFRFKDLCRLGLAMTWPLVLVLMVGLALLTVVLLRR